MEQALTVDRVPEHIARAVVDPHAYAEFDSLHAKLAELRRDHPFARADLEGYPPFWIASKYKDIQEISRQNDLFRSGVYFIAKQNDIDLEYSSGKDSQEIGRASGRDRGGRYGCVSGVAGSLKK